jgi:hypothetical protein
MLCLTDWMLVLLRYSCIFIWEGDEVYLWESFAVIFAVFLLNSGLWYVFGGDKVKNSWVHALTFYTLLVT